MGQCYCGVGNRCLGDDGLWPRSASFRIFAKIRLSVGEVHCRVVTVRTFSHRLIDVLSHRLYRYHRGGGGRLSFPSFPCFPLVLNSL